MTSKNTTPAPITLIRTLGVSLTALVIASCGGSSGGNSTADPIDVSVAIAYVDRPLYVDNEGEMEPVYNNIESSRTFNGGARLILRDSTSSNGSLRDITSAEFGAGELYDVKDLSPSADGKKLVFAMRAPQTPNIEEDDQPTWNLWEYNLETSVLRQVIANNSVAELGHDVDPAYLPDGRIVFSSTRQKGSQAILANESTYHTKSVFSGLTDNRNEIDNDAAVDNDEIGEAFNLHVVQALADSGSQEIIQISFNQSHDLQPTVLDDGRIAFLRWDNISGDDRQSIYTVNPDGTDVSVLYGYHSQSSVNMAGIGSENTSFFGLTAYQGQLLSVLKPRNSTMRTNENNDLKTPFWGGDLLTINYKEFIEVNQAVNGASGSGQRAIYGQTIDLSNQISANGYISSAYPLNDGSDRLLVSRTACRLNNANNTEILSCNDDLNTNGVTEADPFYSIRLFDPSDGTAPLVQGGTEGRMIHDLVVFNETTNPPILLSEITDPNSPTGTLIIDSIYDFDGTLGATPNGVSLTAMANPADPAFANREARFLRIVKAVSMPDDEVYDYDQGAAFGVSNARNMREILGYVPIEPDGSVAVNIPANVAFQIDIIDSDGQRLPEFAIHRNWLSLAPSEVRQCTGCHTAASELPHGRLDAEPFSINPGLPVSTNPFPNTNSTYSLGTAGDTMASVYSDIEGARELSPNIIYTDEWSDDTVLGVTKEGDIELRYAVPGAATVDDIVALVSEIPTNSSCIITWDASCRIIINYETHIQPLWEETRTGESDYQCISCHTNGGNTVQPSGQLTLTNQVVGDRFTSYDELIVNNDTIEIVSPLRYVRDIDDNIVYLTETVTNDNGTPLDDTDDFDEEIDVLDVNGARIPLIESADAGQTTDLRVQRIDESRNLLFVVLDDNGTPDDTSDDIYAMNGNNQIPITDPFDEAIGTGITRRMVDSNARNSRFFDVMTDASNASNDTFNHTRLNQVDDATDDTDDAPLMSVHELRLISEWLDIGAQYYNNPFDIEED